MRRTLLLAIALFVVSAQAACSSSTGDSTIYPVNYNTIRQADATYYNQYSGGGACSLDPTPYVGSNVRATVAIATNAWADSKACGMCVNITATGTGSGGSPLSGSFIGFVNNKCPTCTSDGIDLGLNGDGRWGITWKAVPCPVASTKIQFLFQGSHQWYIKLQARNTRYPVYSMAIQQGGTWRPLVRTADNFFTAGSSVTFPVSAPITVQVTSVTGDVVVDSVASITNGLVFEGTSQFVDCNSGSSSTTSATATTSTPTTTTTAKPTTTTATTASTTTTTTTSKPTTTTTTTTSKPTTASTTTASSTTSKTTTTTGSTTGSSGSTLIYVDSVQAPFEDWSWASVTPQDATCANSGAYSYSFSPVSWSAAYFAYPSGFSSSQYSAVEFYIFSSSTIGSNCTFAFVQGGNPVFPRPVGSITATKFNKITVPLPSGTFNGIWWQDNTGLTSQPRIYLDDVRLIRV